MIREFTKGGSLRVLRAIWDPIRNWNPFINPKFGDYIGSRRHGGPKQRVIHSFRLADLTCGILWAVVILGLTAKMPFSLLYQTLGLSMLATLVNVTCRWFFPEYQIDRVSSEFVPEGAWTSTPGSGPSSDSVSITQIIARYDHEDIDKISLGLRDGSDLLLSGDEDIELVQLKDRFRFQRIIDNHDDTWEESKEQINFIAEWLWDKSIESEVEPKVEDLKNAFRGCFREGFEKAFQGCQLIGITRHVGVRTSRVSLTDAGYVYVERHAREKGIEVISPRKRQKEGTRMEIHGSVNGIVNTGNIKHSQNSVNVSGEPEMITKLIDILTSSNCRNQLSRDSLTEIDDSVAILRTAESQEDASNPAMRQAIRTALNVAKDIIIGAAGNGFYDTLHELVK